MGSARGGRLSQLLLPIRELALQLLALQLLPLPNGVVGILDQERFERVVISLPEKGLVESRQIPVEDGS